MLNIAFFETKPLSFPKIDLGKIWRLLKVTEPRFTNVRSIRDKDGDMREPTWLGSIYHDQKLGKDLFVVDAIYREEGVGHREISSVSEIVSAKDLSHVMTAQELQSKLKLKAPDVDVENDIIAFFKKDTEAAGAVFHDLRERNHGTGTPNGSNLTNSLS